MNNNISTEEEIIRYSNQDIFDAFDRLGFDRNWLADKMHCSLAELNALETNGPVTPQQLQILMCMMSLIRPDVCKQRYVYETYHAIHQIYGLSEETIRAYLQTDTDTLDALKNGSCEDMEIITKLFYLGSILHAFIEIEPIITDKWDV